MWTPPFLRRRVILDNNAVYCTAVDRSKEGGGVLGWRLSGGGIYVYSPGEEIPQSLREGIKSLQLTEEEILDIFRGNRLTPLLTRRQAVRLGRGPDSGICVNPHYDENRRTYVPCEDGVISRNHGQIIYDNRSRVVYQDTSNNGSQISLPNGQKVQTYRGKEVDLFPRGTSAIGGRATINFGQMIRPEPGAEGTMAFHRSGPGQLEIEPGPVSPVYKHGVEINLWKRQ